MRFDFVSKLHWKVYTDDFSLAREQLSDAEKDVISYQKLHYKVGTDDFSFVREQLVDAAEDLIL